MNLEQIFVTYRPQLITTLEDFFQSCASDSSFTTFPHYKETLSILASTVTQGKLVRGCLVCAAAQMCGRKVDSDVLSLAATVEITHTSILISDDFMDQDNLRRGKPSVYFALQKKAVASGFKNPALYGESMATLISYIGFYLTHGILAKTNFTQSELKNILHLLSRNIVLCGVGQIADITAAQNNLSEPTFAEILELYRCKTGNYSFSLPLMLGAVSACADKETLEYLSDYGICAGIIFQVRDDELGIFEDSEKTGKPVGNDVRENKKTLLRHLIFSKAKKEEVELKKLFGSEDITKDDIRYLKDLLSQYGITSELTDIFHKYQTEAEAIIAKLPYEKTQTLWLQELLTFSRTRES